MKDDDAIQIALWDDGKYECTLDSRVKDEPGWEEYQVVSQVHQKGYKVGEKIIRPAQVSVRNAYRRLREVDEQS